MFSLKAEKRKLGVINLRRRLYFVKVGRIRVYIRKSESGRKGREKGGGAVFQFVGEEAQLYFHNGKGCISLRLEKRDVR